MICSAAFASIAAVITISPLAPADTAYNNLSPPRGHAGGFFGINTLRELSGQGNKGERVGCGFGFTRYNSDQKIFAGRGWIIERLPDDRPIGRDEFSPLVKRWLPAASHNSQLERRRRRGGRIVKQRLDRYRAGGCSSKGKPVLIGLLGHESWISSLYDLAQRGGDGGSLIRLEAIVANVGRIDQRERREIDVLVVVACVRPRDIGYAIASRQPQMIAEIVFVIAQGVFEYALVRVERLA